MSSALPWLELHTLNFSYNSIVCLDQSLVRHTHTHTHTLRGSLGNTTLPSLFLQSLLNALKSLDLSHNKIQDCAEFLKVPVFFCFFFLVKIVFFSFLSFTPELFSSLSRSP